MKKLFLFLSLIVSVSVFVEYREYNISYGRFRSVKKHLEIFPDALNVHKYMVVLY